MFGTNHKYAARRLAVGNPMESTPLQMSRLKELGLTTYGARAYLALLHLGVAEARGVSALAKIPTTKVYKSLDQLRERGLAHVTHGKPRKYAPIPLSQFIERRLEEQEEKVDTLREQKDELVSLFPITGDAQVPDGANVLSITGRRNVLRRFADECRTAQEEILVGGATSASGPLARHLGRAADRGVAVRTLDVPMAADDGVTIATFDARVALFVRLSATAAADPSSESAIGTSEAAFVRPLRALLALHAPLVEPLASPFPPLATGLRT
jgi:sugar-specific transcriptional regulator TrmB